MAKNVFDVASWLQKVAAKHPELMQDDDWKAGAEEVPRGFLRQDTFDSRLDRVKKTEREQQDWYSARQPILEFYDRLQARYGDRIESLLDNEDMSGGAMTTSGEYVSKAEMDAIKQRLEELSTGVQRIGLGSVDLTTFMTDAAEEFRERYGKRFNSKEFRKFYEEGYQKGEFADLATGFDRFKTPYEEEKQKVDREQWEKTTAERIRREERDKLLSNAPSPVDGMNSGTSAFFARQRETATKEGSASSSPSDKFSSFAAKLTGTE